MPAYIHRTRFLAPGPSLAYLGAWLPWIIRGEGRRKDGALSECQRRDATFARL